MPAVSRATRRPTAAAVAAAGAAAAAGGAAAAAAAAAEEVLGGSGRCIYSPPRSAVQPLPRQLQRRRAQSLQQRTNSPRERWRRRPAAAAAVAAVALVAVALVAAAAAVAATAGPGATADLFAEVAAPITGPSPQTTRRHLRACLSSVQALQPQQQQQQQQQQPPPRPRRRQVVLDPGVPPALPPTKPQEPTWTLIHWPSVRSDRAAVSREAARRARRPVS